MAYLNEFQKNNIEEWVLALRSGQFTQTAGRLRSRAGGNCCLGVACEIKNISRSYLPTTVEEKGYGYDFPNSVGGKDFVWAFPPNEWMLDQYGLTHEDLVSLSTINDGWADFNDIANILELWAKDDENHSVEYFVDSYSPDFENV